MSMEVVDSKVANQSVEAGVEENGSLKENGGAREPIKFGSHGLDEPPVKGEDKVPEVHFPKNAADEWPEPKQIHSFWIVKYRSFEDQKLKAKFEQSDKDLQKKHQSRSQLIEKLREKRGERSKILSELKVLGEENRQYWSQIDDKRKEIEPLQQALGQLRGAGYGNRDNKISGICSSEQELNAVIKSLQYRMQHETIPLNEEKQIMREIKQLEATRPKVVSNAAMLQKIQESMGEKDALQDQVKLIGVDLDDVRKNRKLVKEKLNQLTEIREAIDNDIRSIEEELNAATEKRDKTFESIHDLRKQREEVNLPFYENRSLLNKAKDLAAKKDVEGLRDLSEKEVNKFISLWSSTKAFREDYERRILPALDSRQMSRDGRIRNPGEQPILVAEVPTRVDTEVAVAKGNVKQPKEPSSNSTQVEAVVPEKDEKEKNSKPPSKEKNIKKPIEVEDDVEEYFVPEKLKATPKVNEIDEKKLKEMKREEEKEKAKQALERKKKLAEKAAAKAAVRAQKEAEKKEKEREKRLKKAGATATPLEPEEQSDTSKEAVAEEEKVEDLVETAVPEKNTGRKGVVKLRKRTKGLDSHPKTFIKRKKATNYWMWGSAGAAAAVAIILLAIAGYMYLV